VKKEYYDLIIKYVIDYQKYFNENKDQRIVFLYVKGAKKLAQAKYEEIINFFKIFAKTNEIFGLLHL